MSLIVPQLQLQKNEVLASYNFVDNRVEFAYSPGGYFNGLPAIGYDDAEFLRTPYVVIPRLAEMENWMMKSNKNTNWFLFWKDPLVQILWQMLRSMVIGDGAKIKIFDDDDQTAENEELTKIVQEWTMHPCGASPDNRDKTLNNFVIPLILIDNLTCGASAWYKFIGESGISGDDEIGEMMIKWMDPRSYVPIRHDYYGWFKLIQFPIVQPGLPATRDVFDKQWRPAIRSWIRNLSSVGQTMDMPEIHIPSSDFYWFNCFLRPPLSTITDQLISKMLLSFYRDKFIEKSTFPFFIIKVPRHAMRDRNEQEFQDKLNRISQLMSEYRSGDAFSIEGQEYDDDGNVLSMGWEVQPFEVKSNLNFSEMFRTLDEQIAWGMYMALGMVATTGIKGNVVHNQTQVESNVHGIAKTVRASIIETLKYIIRDLIEFKKGKILEMRKISCEFSKIREADAALFLNTMSTLNGMGALTTNEARMFSERIGFELDPLPDILTPEGQAVAQVNMSSPNQEGMLGPVDGMESDDTTVPDGVMKPPSPDHVRPGYHKHEDVWEGKPHPTKVKHRKYKTHQEI